MLACCRHPSIRNDISPVTGRPSAAPCWLVRQGSCGKDGKLWEQRVDQNLN
jgi:hypothetical protein